ncbi:hypothetical protein [Bacillus sp. AFS017336]|uniref:hypothetical protein n=1 Tax=Bacillus sp. AFS017336 TaxID=2033489 RepID=UPI000BF07E62|nr:hypothetical protein [Bacillus sp. AFS017336]
MKVFDISIKDIKKFLIALGTLTLLGGLFFIYISNEKLPQQNNLLVVNGVFDWYQKALSDKDVDSIYLKDGSNYDVPYLSDNQLQRKTFIKDVKSGQHITLWVYKHTGENTVLAIKSNNTTYLSFNDAINEFKASNNQSKFLGLLAIPLSIIFFGLNWWMCIRFKKDEY